MAEHPVDRSRINGRCRPRLMVHRLLDRICQNRCGPVRLPEAVKKMGRQFGNGSGRVVEQLSGVHIKGNGFFDFGAPFGVDQPFDYVVLLRLPSSRRRSRCLLGEVNDQIVDQIVQLFWLQVINGCIEHFVA